MSTLATNAITDAAGGNTATINSYTPTESNMAGRNRIINGDMRIDQRNAGASVSCDANVYGLDRWQHVVSQASKLTVQQNAGAVTPPVGFTNYMGFTSTSAYSVGTTEYFYFQQSIEGNNIADLAWGTASAASVTLSFRVYSSLTGTFGGSLQNNAKTRSYPFTYTVSSANTWTTINITVAGDTTGTWLTTNGVGVSVIFGLGIGLTSLLGTAGAWAAADYRSATGATSVVGTSGATFYITGVQLEAGSAATPFERRFYGQELQLAQRYYQQSYDIGTVAGTVTANGQIGWGAVNAGNGEFFQVRYPVFMRTAPTITTYNPATGASGSVFNTTHQANVTASINGGGMGGFSNLNNALTTGSTYLAHYTASAEL